MWFTFRLEKIRGFIRITNYVNGGDFYVYGK